MLPSDISPLLCYLSCRRRISPPPPLFSCPPLPPRVRGRMSVNDPEEEIFERDKVYPASKFSRESFLKWSAHWIFVPRSGIKVKVEGYVQTKEEFNPPKTCNECRRAWRRSGLERIVQDVEWGALKALEDVDDVDPKLEALAAAVQGVNMCGYTNGLSKCVTMKLLEVVTQNALCTQHKRILRVNCPGSSSSVYMSSSSLH